MSLPQIFDAFDRCATVRALAERIPARGSTLRLGGVPGSSGAVLATWLTSHVGAGRLVTIIATTPADAERWLTDLQHLAGEGVALYPQREALGEDEPHFEIAGERVETLESLLRGELRLLVTTARASAERTAVPSALESLRLQVAVGDDRPLREVVDVARADGLRSRPDRGRSRRILGSRRHRRCVRLRHGLSGADRVVGRQRQFDSRLRSHHATLRRRPARCHHPADPECRRRRPRRRPTVRSNDVRCWNCSLPTH